MLNQHTLEQLRELKFTGMLQAVESQMTNPELQSLSFEERLALIVDSEVHERTQRRVKRLETQAKLKHSNACIEDIIYQPGRGLDKSKIASLVLCQWIDKSQNLIITGPTGAGKTWMTCAFAKAAIRLGKMVLYYRVSRLLEETEIARADGSLPKLRAKIAKSRLLVLDDWGLSPLTDMGRQDLLEYVDDRAGNGSIIISSQLPEDAWYRYIDEPTLAEAILDRIIHSSHQIELKGGSMRKTLGLKEEK